MDTVTLLGVRGSIPVSGESFLKYGCATTCLLIQMDGELIVIDGGSGLLSLQSSVLDRYSHASILISHPHSDHILGLTMAPLVFRPGYPIDVYGSDREGLSLRQQINRIFSPPLWPIKPEQLPADLTFHDLPESFQLGSVQITAMEGVHPGGVSLFRICGSKHTAVIATDCTYTEEFIPAMAEFAQDCDLLVCDGQYFDEEWPARSTFGHNTWRAAAELGNLCRAKQTRVLHHDPTHTDAALDAAAAEMQRKFANCRLGYEGEEILL